MLGLSMGYERQDSLLKCSGETVCLAFWVLSMSIVCADPACASELDVVISELHYNPASGSNSDEFLEIYNSGPLEVDLADWQLTDGVLLTFPPGLVLPARSFLVVSPNATYTVTRYGISNVFGDYAGSLSNGGEIVSLVNAEGDTIPGLYAAGEVAGIYYRVYTGATSVMRGAVTGRLAGGDAALRRNASG